LSRLIELEGVGAPPSLAEGARARGSAEVLERYAVVVLLMLVAVGFTLRAAGLGRIGFAEDEINKLDAVAAYARGDLAQNSEHPMVMKALIFVSVGAARAWNGAAPEAARISDEAAVRLPNVLLGALTVIPLYLLAAAFFGRRTALVAAALWAFGVNAVTYNRVAKEDTLLVFFMLYAFYFYVRAKATSGFDPARKRRYYVLSAVSWGLTFASKYFPHYFGLNMLYHHMVSLREREPGEPRGSTPGIFYVVVAAAFLIVNPAVLLPQTWAYLSAYSSESLLTHHGYLMGETLYDNVMSKTPFGGTPVYFYALYLLFKTPPALLAAFAAGLFVCARRRREPGPAFLLLMFVLWVVPFSLTGAKWLRYVLSLMPLVYMIAAVGVVWLAGAARSFVKEGRRAAVGACVVAVFVCAPAWAAFASAPHYALYTNALSPRPAGYFFPHDELYDDGLREAILYVCARAPQGSTLAHETPGVVRYYLGRCGRDDLRSRAISDPGFDPTSEPGPVYAILQRGRTYFENRDEMARVRREFTLEHRIHVGGVTAAEIYVKQ
jgi:hypothetical protein